MVEMGTHRISGRRIWTSSASRWVQHYYSKISKYCQWFFFKILNIGELHKMFKDKMCKLMDERSISAYKLSKETGMLLVLA